MFGRVGRKDRKDACVQKTLSFFLTISIGLTKDNASPNSFSCYFS